MKNVSEWVKVWMWNIFWINFSLMLETGKITLKRRKKRLINFSANLWNQREKKKKKIGFNRFQQTDPSLLLMKGHWSLSKMKRKKKVRAVWYCPPKLKAQKKDVKKWLTVSGKWTANDDFLILNIHLIVFTYHLLFNDFPNSLFNSFN